MTVTLKVEVIVGPSEGVSPQIIRRNISTSFISSAPQNHPEKIPFKQNSLDFDRKIDLDLGTDVIIVEPQNFEQLMLKSLGLDWNVEEDKIESGETTKEIQSQNHRRKSEKHKKREIKEVGVRKIIVDKRKVKDDSATAASATDDNEDYDARGNLGDDSLAEESERTNVKEEALFSPELGSKAVKVELLESGRKNLKEQLFSSLLNLKESVAELKEGISFGKGAKGKKGKKEKIRKKEKGGKRVKKMKEKEREMDYGLWQPFYNVDVDDEVCDKKTILMFLLQPSFSSLTFLLLFSGSCSTFASHHALATSP